MALVVVEKICKAFRRGRSKVVAVDDVSLTISSGETFAVIGESGSGKSTLGRLMLRLMIPDSGRIIFDGRDITHLKERELRSLRAEMGVVFQEPYESLDPRLRIEEVIAEPIKIHNNGMSRGERRREVHAALERVALDPSLATRFPGELSGGQQQRVGVARAIVTNPRFLVLDEPTSSLDLSVRAQIINLLIELQKERNLAYLLISHDIPTVQVMNGLIGVMYLGELVEIGTARDVCLNSRHPYTRALISSSLSPDPTIVTRQIALRSDEAAQSGSGGGCKLANRCPIALPECTQERVTLEPLTSTHAVACIRAGESALIER